MALSQTSVLKLYNTVIEDVIVGVRESFADEGVDEQVLQELKQIWETKLMSSKAVELNPDPPEPQPPQINAHKGVNVAKTGTNVGNHFVQQAQQQQTGTVVQQQQHNQVQAQNQMQMQQTTQQQMLSKGIALPQPAVPVQQVVTAPAAVLERQVPIQITLPAQGDSSPRVLTIHVPVSAISGNQLQTILTAAVINAAMSLPPDYATSLLQQHVNNALQGQAGLTPVQQQQGNISQLDGEAGDMSDEETDVRNNVSFDISKMINIVQLDGAHGDSSEDDDEEEEEDNDDDDEDLDDREEEENDDSAAREEEPLNSGDDVSEDDDPTDLFDTENVVVCQYDKITRSRNKWKFYLKDGIMNLNGKDYVFQKATGDAEW